MNIKKMKMFFCITLLTIGCSHGAPLNSTYSTPTSKTFLKAIKPTTVHIKEFKDNRDVINYNVIGTINEVVADISSEKLSLEDSPSIFLLDSMKKEFTNSGFTLTEDKAELTISGTIKEFKLDISSRDEITIEINYKIMRNIDKKVIFDGQASISDSRFIGVTGNTRKSLNEYLNKGLHNISRQTLTSTGLVIETEIETNTKENLTTDSHYKTKSTATTIEDNRGTFYGYGTPNKIKVYIEGVYYGQTPISIKLKPGIYNVSFKKKGFSERNPCRITR